MAMLGDSARVDNDVMLAARVVARVSRSGKPRRVSVSELCASRPPSITGKSVMGAVGNVVERSVFPEGSSYAVTVSALEVRRNRWVVGPVVTATNAPRAL